MGILTKTCEEGGILRSFGRRLTVDLPPPSGGWISGAAAVALGAQLVLARTRMPLPMTLTFEVLSQDTNARVFTVEGFDHFDNPRSETVTVAIGVANVASYRRTQFAYDRVTSITLASGGALNAAGGGANQAEYAAVGVQYRVMAAKTRLGLPFAIRGATDIEYVAVGSDLVSAPVVQTGNFWLMELPYVCAEQPRLTIHFRSEARFKY